MSTLRIEGLHTGYGPVDVLEGVDFSTEGVAVAAILGPNGSGKTTLIRAVTGQLRPRRGVVCLDGMEISERPSHEIARLGVATVPQGRGIFAELSVEENLTMGGHVLRDRERIHVRRDAMYDRFPILRERAGQAAGSLSGGEQMMLAVARAMLSEPRLLILDEPSEGLAPKVVQELFQDLAAYSREEEGRVVLVEQNVRQTLALADRVFVLVQGRIVASGPPSDFESPEELMELYLTPAGSSDRPER
jgi:branched-chain amino acid transport system ATP-binding protein